MIIEQGIWKVRHVIVQSRCARTEFWRHASATTYANVISRTIQNT
jgi:hypothetical protein